MFSLLILLKKRLIIYYNKFKTSNLIISNSSSPSTKLLDRTDVLCMFKCPLGDCVSNENNAYIGLTTMILSRHLTMYLNDSSSIALHLKATFFPNPNFRKLLAEIAMIELEIIKPKLQTLEALHIKTKRSRINRINFENSDNVLKCL